MTQTLQKTIEEICQTYGNDKGRMIDIVIDLQKKVGGISTDAMDIIAKCVKATRIDVESVVSFYAFLSKENKGKVVIRLCNDIVDQMNGMDDVAAAFEDALGIKAGETTADGNITLEYTPCIGMCDQAPAAMINKIIAPSLTADKAKAIVEALKENSDPAVLNLGVGDGNNADELIKSAVRNNLKKAGDVIFADREGEAGLKAALELSPEDVIEQVKVAGLRGRGGAGFPTGLKWEFTRGAARDEKYILCNADEGEPGTFKDRVLLTEKYDLVFEGMTIAGYAIGAQEGVMYLRGEYAYLRNFLEAKLKARRDAGLLGEKVCGKDSFSFDIRIQSGAGAYICGEESALISSCEGLRGDPKTRPPFPAQKGYNASPTSVNNVETFASVSRILEKGAHWYTEIGTADSSGTKVLSVSGDCANPGIYEVPFGTTIAALLKDVGASDTLAVLVAGPSGQFIGEADFGKKIAFEELATGGAIVIFDKTRNILKVAEYYMDFFIEESCGYCTPCRVGNVLLKNCLEKIIKGKGEASDFSYMEEIGSVMKATSRCGLGQTSANPVLSTIKNFKSAYEALMTEQPKGMEPTFDIKAALKDGEDVAGRQSVIFT